MASVQSRRAPRTEGRPSAAPTLRERAFLPPRLQELLRQRFATGMLLVQAPAGCGKTAAIVQFLQDAGVEPWWHTCSADDADPATLLRGLVTAMGGGASVGGQTTLAALAAGEARQSHKAALKPFLDELDQQGSVLVIDDADALLDAPAALDALDHLIASCTPMTRVILVSRAEVPLGSQAKRLLEGQAARVMAEDLLFRQDEIAAFAESAYRVTLSDDETERLYRATGGWAIALGLALRLRDLGTSMERDGGHAQFTPEARSDLFAYLASEVLSRIDERIGSFLRQTAILEELDPAICGRLTGEERPVELIQSLARAGLPVVKSGWGTYRCHSLLREYLLDAQTEAVRRESHHRAAGAYADAGMWVQALDHYIEAGDTEAALAIGDEHGRALFFGGHGQALLALVKQSPGGVLSSHLRARYWAAYSASRMLQLDWAAEAFEAIHADAAAASDSSMAQDALAGLTHTLNGWGRYPAAAEAAARLLQTVPEDDRSDRAAVTLGYLITGMGATTQFREAVENIHRLLPDLFAEPRAQQAREAYARSVAAVTLAMEGDIKTARGQINLARMLILGGEDDDIHTFVPWSSALVEFMAADPDAADAAAQEAEALALRYGDLQRVLECRAVQACTATMRGDVEEADQRFAQLDELRGGGTDYWGVILTLLSRPERSRLHGDLPGALSAAEANHALAVGLGGGRFVCSTRLDVSYYRMLSGDAEAAREQARTAVSEADALAAGVLIYGANLMLAASSPDDEDEAMAIALRVADERDYRFVMPYAARLPELDAALWRALGGAHGARAAMLLREMGTSVVKVFRSAAHSITAEALIAAAGLLAEFGPEGRAALKELASTRGDDVGAAAASALAGLDAANPHRLSPRELEILDLLSRGMRTKDVAARLYLTPATVSTHIQRIMTKTNTASRAELLALAARDGAALRS